MAGSNRQMMGKLVTDGKTPKEVYVDVSHEIISISHEHSKVHQGKFFSTGYYVNPIAASGVVEILIHTHASYTMHLYTHVSCGGDAEARIFEAPTVSAAGTALTVTNNNRTSSNTPNATITHTPTTTADGTQLDATTYVPGGTGGNAVGAMADASEEQFVLAPDTYYLIRLTNISGVTQPGHIHLNFYEV